MFAHSRFNPTHQQARGIARRWMVAALLAGPFAAQVAHAQTTDPFATLAAPSIPATVTVSQSTSVATPTTYVAYPVSLSNVSNRQITTISISGSISVTGSLNAPTIWSIGSPGFCTATTTSFSCNFSTLAPGASLTIPVIVKVPSYSPAAPVGTEAINVTYSATFKNGNTSTSSQSSFGTLSGATTTPVSDLSPTSVKSLVIKAGGTFFTAANGVATPAAKLTASVIVPELPTGDYTTATLTRVDGTGCTNFKDCYAALVSVPGYVSAPMSPSYLTVILRQDASNIKPGAKIESVLIRYTPDAVPGGPTPTSVILAMCASPTLPNEGSLYGVPCIAKTTYYKSNKVPGWTPDLDSDFEWTLINHKNGRYGTE